MMATSRPDTRPGMPPAKIAPIRERPRGAPEVPVELDNATIVAEPRQIARTP